MGPTPPSSPPSAASRLVPRRVRAAFVLGAVWVASWSSSDPVRFPEAQVPTTSVPDVVRITIGVPAVPDHPWGAEAVGTALALVERGLAELPTVVPVVDGAAAMPGLGAAPAGVPWRLELVLAVTDTTLTVEGTLCDASKSCTPVTGEGPRTLPHPGITSLVRQVAARLALAEGPGVDTLSRPETPDDYAGLLLGRSAAVFFGVQEGPPVEAEGDRSRDPMARAVYVDPKMVTGQALLARSSRPDAQRLEAAQLAVQGDAASVVRDADLAAVLEAQNQPLRARERWRAVGERAPSDPRFVLPRARVELEAGDLGAVKALLARLPASSAEDAAVLAVYVGVADREGGATDELLQRWQVADASNPEPVRRRVTVAVDQGDLAGARALLPALTERGAADEAARLQLALASELGDLAGAARAAGALGAADLALQLQAASTKGSPQARLAALEGLGTPEARLARGEALLVLGKPGPAAREAGLVLADHPWSPEALHLLARARVGMGEDATDVERRLRMADPWYGRSLP